MIRALTLFFLCPLFCIGQTGESVFNDSIVHEVLIETTNINWFDTLESDFKKNYENPAVYPETYRQCNIILDGVRLDSCGFREKGNSSNTLTSFGRKKPLKIAFDEFKEQTLDGLKKINLNNFTNDPSLLHDALAFKLMRDAGMIASRTAYAKVYVNGEYLGLYIMIENVDKTFLKMNYGGKNNDGNLYKTDRNAKVTLEWKGDSPKGYTDQKMKLTTNEDLNDWSGFISFVKMINHDTLPGFRERFESRFDIHNYLKILAIEKLIRSWDNYVGGGNNFYLYDHPDGMLRWIPWDMNESFQDLKMLDDTKLLTGYLVPTNKYDERPLLKRIFEMPEYKSEYLYQTCRLIQTVFNADNLGEYILYHHQLIREAYNQDPNKYNSLESFDKSLTEFHDDELSVLKSSFVLRITYPGIFPVIERQRKWAEGQMSAWGYQCIIAEPLIDNLYFYPNPASSYITIRKDSSLDFDYSRFMLIDPSGRKILQTTYSNNTGRDFTLDISSIPAGFYLLIKESSTGHLQRSRLVVH